MTDYDDQVRAILGWPTPSAETPQPDLAADLRAMLAETRRKRQRELANRYPGQLRRATPKEKR